MRQLPEDHVCRGCVYNIMNERCANTIEVDADCDTCKVKGDCLFTNPDRSKK
jgi:hypothetical protein